MFSSLVLSINRAAAATVLWVVSIMLLLGETFGDWPIEPGTLGRWALLTGLMATCCTVSVMINHARSIVLECMSWEHKNILSEHGQAHGQAHGESMSLVPPLKHR